MNSPALARAALDRSSLRVLRRNRRLLSCHQRQMLEATLTRMEAYPQCFDRSGSDYQQRSGIVLMSDWERAHKFTHCTFHGRSCGLWKFCPYCAYVRRNALVEKFLPFFHLTRWHFLTISFTGHLLFGPESPDDITDYWNACLGAIRSLERESVISGAICVEELHIRCLDPCRVLPHCHFLISADEVSDGTLDDLEERVRAHVCTVPCQDFDGVEPNRDAEIRLPVTTRCCELESERDLDRVLRYLVKPIDIVEPYETAIRNLDEDELEGRIQLNQNTEQFLQGHAIYSEDRRQMSYLGNLDARTRARCLLHQPG